MKKVLFRVLMFSAMFMIASCGSKSNSGEAATEAEDEVAKVEFADPAIVFDNGIDLTNYFSAESLSQPTIYKDTKTLSWHLSVNVKLKLIKDLDMEAEGAASVVIFVAKFCNKNGTMIASARKDKVEMIDHITELKEGAVISLDFLSKEEEVLESEMKELLKKVEKIEISISTYNYKSKTEE